MNAIAVEDRPTAVGVTFQREEFTEALLVEMWPLWLKHYDEISAYKDIPFDPDLGKYAMIAQAGALRIFTMRDAGMIVGYEVLFAQTNPHYKTSLQAVQDILFVDPELRKGLTGYKFIRWVDRQLKAEGVQIVYQHIKAKHNFGVMLERQGYHLVDLIYAKRLDQEG